MAGSFKKGANPPGPRVVIPKIEDYIDVSSLAGGLPAAPGLITEDWVAKNGTSINGQSLAQLIADRRSVRG